MLHSIRLICWNSTGTSGRPRDCPWHTSKSHLFFLLTAYACVRAIEHERYQHYNDSFVNSCLLEKKKTGIDLEVDILA